MSSEDNTIIQGKRRLNDLTDYIYENNSADCRDVIKKLTSSPFNKLQNYYLKNLYLCYNKHMNASYVTVFSLKEITLKKSKKNTVVLTAKIGDDSIQYAKEFTFKELLWHILNSMSMQKDENTEEPSKKYTTLNSIDIYNIMYYSLNDIIEEDVYKNYIIPHFAESINIMRMTGKHSFGVLFDYRTHNMQGLITSMEIRDMYQNQFYSNRSTFLVNRYISLCSKVTVVDKNIASGESVDEFEIPRQLVIYDSEAKSYGTINKCKITKIDDELYFTFYSVIRDANENYANIEYSKDVQDYKAVDFSSLFNIEKGIVKENVKKDFLNNQKEIFYQTSKNNLLFDE
jgi:hypothetical protein